MAKADNKKSANIMHVKERKNRHGEISYELYCSGKDPVSRKNKLYVKTFKLPAEITSEKDKNAFKLKCQLEWREEVKKISLGTVLAKSSKNIKFIDFAKEWVDDILNYNKLSHNYYVACKQRVKVMEHKLGNYYLHEISKAVFKNFCKWLNERTYKKYTVTVKASLMPIIKEQGFTITKAAENANISHATIFDLLNVGGKVNRKSAKKITDYLKVPIAKYFDIEVQDIPYSQNTNKSIKNTLHNILNAAVEDKLIDTNNAISKEKLTGIKQKREIYNDEEVRQFIKYIELETDIRKQVAFSIYIYLGLRNSEVAGLEWQDIDFETGEIAIQRNCLYISKEFGIITKETKTKNSNRSIHMPDCLTTLLKQYKIWWDKQKELHGDLWEDTDRLFCQNNGNDMSGMTIRAWLKAFEESNNLKYVSPHGLRHTNITMLIKNGIDVKTVSGRVGHANISTTLDIYSHFTKEADKLAANKIQELFAVNL